MPCVPVKKSKSCPRGLTPGCKYAQCARWSSLRAGSVSATLIMWVTSPGYLGSEETGDSAISAGSEAVSGSEEAAEFEEAAGASLAIAVATMLVAARIKTERKTQIHFID